MKIAPYILAICFSLLGLFPNSDLCEMRKLPALFEHYLEHRQADGDSFFEFLYEDYLSDVGDKENHHGNWPTKEMPFQNHSSQTHCCNFIPHTLSNYELNQPQYETENFFNTHSFNYSFLYLNTIFQPPRI